MAEPKLLFCGVRDGVDTWQLECRFDDGQKFAAVEVDIEHEELAAQIAAYLNRSAAERVELRLAEVRIKQLQEQLTACEVALAERDARVLSLSRLVWGAVHNAGRMLTSGRIPRWVAVRDALAVGSTSANQLCREHKLDPDEQVGRGDLCGGCKPSLSDVYLEVCGGCICSEEESQSMSHSLQAETKIKPKSASRAIKCIYVGKWSPSDRKLLQRAMDDGAILQVEMFSGWLWFIAAPGPKLRKLCAALEGGGLTKLADS